jgi:Co/Zn/Cd efflux system component
VTVVEPGDPLVGGTSFNTSGWSLINLLLCLLTALMMLVRVIPALRNSNHTKRKSRLATFIPAFAAVVVFILTQDMSKIMQMVDMWTPWMVVIAVVQLLIFFFGAKMLKEDEQPANDANEY